MSLNFLCFSSKDYLPKWRILYKSIKKFHPESTIYLFGFNDVEATDVPSDVVFEKLTYVTNMPRERPVQILKLFDKGVDNIVHLGSDCELFSRLTEVERYFNSGAVDLILTPHLLQPLPFDGKSPSNEDIQLHGLINADFMAIKNTPNARNGMEWFAWVCTHHCRNEPDKGVFADQTWLACLQNYMNKVAILRNRSYNVAYWNVHLYNLKWDAVNQIYTTDNGPLAFFHYSGFREDYPALMSKYQNRHVATGPILKIYQEYANKLIQERTGVI